jgi:hypothetical protein
VDAETVRQLTAAGYTRESAESAVRAEDLGLLVHTAAIRVSLGTGPR